MPIVKGFVGFGGGRVVPWGMGVARRITLVGLVKLKKMQYSQTPRPVTGNLEVEPMDSKIFFRSGTRGFLKFSSKRIHQLYLQIPQTHVASRYIL